MANRARLKTILSPTPTTMSPEIKLKIGNNRSGKINCEAKRVIIPRAKTPAVWVMVTVSPRKAAWRAVPRAPTRYAPTTALPCPGESACIPPKKVAINKPINAMVGVTSGTAISSASRSRVWTTGFPSRVCSAVAFAGIAPKVIENSAIRSLSGAVIRFSG